MVGRKGLSGSQQAVTYTSRRAGCRQAAEQDGQRTRGRPAGRPLARHSAAQRLSSIPNNALGQPTARRLVKSLIGLATRPLALQMATFARIQPTAYQHWIRQSGNTPGGRTDSLIKNLPCSERKNKRRRQSYSINDRKGNESRG